MERDTDLARIAERRHGVFDRRLLDDLGYGRQLREKRRTAGRWVEVWEGVHRMAGAPVTWRGTLLAALECESFEWHTAKEALTRDSARRNAMVAAGWLPIAVTADDLRSGGSAVCDRIRRLRWRAA